MAVPPPMLPTPAQLSTFFVENAPATNEAFRSVYENAVGFYLGGPDGSLADWEEVSAFPDASCVVLLRECV